MLNAKERLEEAERAVYHRVCAQLAESAVAISPRRFSHCQAGMSLPGWLTPRWRTATSGRRWIQGNAIRVTNGRHPVVERVLDTSVTYVPNDVDLSNEGAQGDGADRPQHGR